MTRVKKRCEKCGKVALYRPRERRCKLQNFGPNALWCYGKLARVVETPRRGRHLLSCVHVDGRWLCAADCPLHVVVDVDAERATVPARRVVKRPQDVAAAKLVRARKMVDAWNRKLATAARLARKWEATARRYARAASMTDAEVAAERAARLARKSARPVRRGIKLGAAS